MGDPLRFEYKSFTAQQDGTTTQLTGDPNPDGNGYTACEQPNPPPWCENAANVPLTGFDYMLVLSFIICAAVIYKKSVKKLDTNAF